MSSPYPGRDALKAHGAGAAEEEEETDREESREEEETRRSRAFNERLPRVLEASARLQAIMGVASREGADTTTPAVPGFLSVTRGPSVAEWPAGNFPFRPPFPPAGTLEREMHRRAQQQRQQQQQPQQQYQQRQRGPQRAQKREMDPLLGCTKAAKDPKDRHHPGPRG